MTDKTAAHPGARKKQRRQREIVAADTLEMLNHQAEVVRAELAGLQQNLADVQHGLTTARADALREANEQLVLAALHAETIAEQAVSHLDELARSSQHDVLTDTPNRALMLDRLENAIALARRHRTRIAVLFLDLDEFKNINDTLGHSVGDAVVQLVARRLKEVVRDSDTVSRHGGDEFLVLMAEITQPADAAVIAEKIVAALAATHQVGDHLISLSVSIGIALFPEDGGDAATLITRADAAMYVCKKLGGGTFQFYSGPDVRTRNLPQPQREARREVLSPRQTSTLTDLRDANEQLVRAALSAQELQEQTEQKYGQQLKFMAMVAHELRNPLTPIRTAAGLLRRVQNGDLMASVQDLIESQVAHMCRLVEDLLDSTRVGTGKFRVEMSTVEMTDVLSRAIETCHAPIETRHQHLKVRMPAPPVNIQGDPVRLAQIFNNLLDNASQYTPQGGDIAVLAELENDTLVVTVSDNGIGIAPAALAGIFDLFVQDERPRPLHKSGLGIGLAVVRELVEAHGGTIVAHSAGMDLGSEFIVTLPTVRAGFEANSSSPQNTR